MQFGAFYCILATSNNIKSAECFRHTLTVPENTRRQKETLLLATINRGAKTLISRVQICIDFSAGRVATFSGPDQVPVSHRLRKNNRCASHMVNNDKTV